MYKEMYKNMETEQVFSEEEYHEYLKKCIISDFKEGKLKYKYKHYLEFLCLDDNIVSCEEYLNFEYNKRLHNLSEDFILYYVYKVTDYIEFTNLENNYKFHLTAKQKIAIQTFLKKCCYGYVCYYSNGFVLFDTADSKQNAICTVILQGNKLWNEDYDDEELGII